MQPFWSFKRSLQAEIIILGAGIVGLSTALFLKRNHPNMDVLVINKDPLPAGASVKNAGFACVGSPSEILSDVSTSGYDECRELILNRFKGLELLKTTLGASAIQYIHTGASELFTIANSNLYQKCLDQQHILNDLFHSATGIERNFRIKQNPGEAYGFKGFVGEIAIEFEGQINSGEMMKSLLATCLNEGVRYESSINVEGYSSGKQVRIQASTADLKCDHLVICTNGYTSHLLDGYKQSIRPGRTQVLLTEEIPGLSWSKNFHIDRGYYYFRNINGRILLGGGRNLDFEGEATDSEGLNDRIQHALESILFEHIIPNKEVKIEQRWSGILGLGDDKLPYCTSIDTNIHLASKMGGMGIALGMQLGKQMADAL